jgi:hypothetical protein
MLSLGSRRFSGSGNIFLDHTDDDKTSISPIIISRRWPEIGVTGKLNPVRRLHRLMIEEIKDHQCYENVGQPRPLSSSDFDPDQTYLVAD